MDASKQESATGRPLPPNAGKGRPAGSLNKTTRAAKEAIAFAAEGLGGAERLIDWAKEDPLNERAFWTQIYPKLLPHTLASDPDNPLGLTVKLSAEAQRLMGELVPSRANDGESAALPD